jgi:hypothetical protein
MRKQQPNIEINTLYELLILLSMFLQLNVPNVFMAEPVKILPRSSNNESIIT